MDKKMNSYLMEHVQKQLFSFNPRMGSSGEGKRRDEFAVWHVARLAEWHNYAECKIWKRAQTNKLNWKTWARLCRAFFLAPIWVSNFFSGPFITAGLIEQGRAESSDKL